MSFEGVRLDTYGNTNEAQIPTSYPERIWNILEVAVVNEIGFSRPQPVLKKIFILFYLNLLIINYYFL